MDTSNSTGAADAGSAAPLSVANSFRKEMRQHSAREWRRRFSHEYQRSCGGRVDIDYLSNEARTLYPFLGHRPPEECARQLFGFNTGADNLEIQAEQKFRTLAGNIGLIQHGQPLPEDLKSFAHGVAELCAVSADQYRHPKDGSAGDHIRATFGALPF